MSLHFPPIDALMPRLIAKSSVASGLHALKAQDFVGPGGGVGVERGSLVDLPEVIRSHPLVWWQLGTNGTSRGNGGGTLANIRNVVFVVLYADQRDSEVSVPDSWRAPDGPLTGPGLAPDWPRTGPLRSTTAHHP